MGVGQADTHTHTHTTVHTLTNTKKLNLHSKVQPTHWPGCESPGQTLLDITTSQICIHTHTNMSHINTDPQQESDYLRNHIFET